MSVDDLVTHLGVHRKRGPYLIALRRRLADDVRPLTDALAATTLPLVTSADLGLLLLAAVERAPADEEVADEVAAAPAAIDQAIAGALGQRLRGARTSSIPIDHGVFLADHLLDRGEVDEVPVVRVDELQEVVAEEEGFEVGHIATPAVAVLNPPLNLLGRQGSVEGRRNRTRLVPAADREGNQGAA
ncbi:hypothetical protein AB0M80_42700 [Amycolatopsis sp. NPDC051045]|uniref:hypothetical protein n=1 Tax=Amycolatopsis sp. NPDC051045 TaxID=3156922 RepID=UPI0034233061